MGDSPATVSLSESVSELSGLSAVVYNHRVFGLIENQ